MINSLHHVQIAMPAGQEAEAVAFYVGVLGLKIVEKPLILKHRGGVWFELGNVRVHLGVEEPFSPAKKAHPAFEVHSIDAMSERLTQRGCAVEKGSDLPGVSRIYVHDPFGNRIELLQRTLHDNGSPT